MSQHFTVFIFNLLYYFCVLSHLLLGLWSVGSNILFKGNHLVISYSELLGFSTSLVFLLHLYTPKEYHYKYLQKELALNFKSTSDITTFLTSKSLIYSLFLVYEIFIYSFTLLGDGSHAPSHGTFMQVRGWLVIDNSFHLQIGLWKQTQFIIPQACHQTPSPAEPHRFLISILLLNKFF